MTSENSGRLAVGAALFFILATANSGGYRYGASDQAFYIPAIRKAMDASLFPRDASLLAAQGHVILWDGLVAGLTAITQLPLPWIFFLLYAAGVLALYAGGTLIARAVGLSRWSTIAFLALLTLRHRIAKTGVNTLEGYLHPRMLAFACGTLAIAAFLRRRPGWTIAAIAVAGALHPTTGVWFAMLLGVAAIVAWPRWRVPLIALAVVGAAGAAWAIAAGPLSPRAVVMDSVWLSAISTKDYLFPNNWPAYAWVLNLLAPAIVAAALWRMRDISAELRGLFAGALALTAFFIATLPLVAMQYALAVQLQIPRVFWLVELLAFVAICVAVARPFSPVARPFSPVARPFSPVARPFRARGLALFLLLLSIARGATLFVTEAERALVKVDLPAGDWQDAMNWLKAQPVNTHVLADPGHAWRYGSSVRVAAERDVFTEDVKDAAIAMYDRDVAVRVVERGALTSNFASKTPDELKTLASTYAIDFLVSDERLDLPVAYENPAFRVYRFR